MGANGISRSLLPADPIEFQKEEEEIFSFISLFFSKIFVLLILLSVSTYELALQRAADCFNAALSMIVHPLGSTINRVFVLLQCKLFRCDKAPL